MSHPLFDLSGRVAMVSGAASGMGKQMAIGFAEAGADVVLADINLPGADRTADAIASLGIRTLAVECDVSDVEQVRSLYRTIDDEFGRIDIVGNVAGEGHTGRPEELPVEKLEEVLQNLVVGRFTSCQEAGRRMLKQGKGSIINFGSIGGWNSLGRGHTPYGMAMAAGIQMTRELSTEWASRGVRVNAILPAQVWNDGLRARVRAVPELEQTFLGGIPMGRLGNAEEIKGPAIFLASDASSFVTGAILPMDGGNLAMNAGGTYPGSPRAYA
ncbi:MAG: SDR family oxidoreductase [Chloroflexi bacterium]|nr:SDR family oxidoreductase [Chloroflexota bacterium]